MQGPWYDAGMADSRKRRIVKRVVLGVATVATLACSYVTAYMAAAWYEGARLGGDPVIRNLVIFEPLREYAGSRAPGSLEFATVQIYCVNNGEFSFSQMHALVKQLRDEGKL